MTQKEALNRISAILNRNTDAELKRDEIQGKTYALTINGHDRRIDGLFTYERITAATTARNYSDGRMCRRRAKTARNGTETAKSGYWWRTDNPARYVTQYITLRNVCSTQTFHSKRAAILIDPTRLSIGNTKRISKHFIT